MPYKIEFIKEENHINNWLWTDDKLVNKIKDYITSMEKTIFNKEGYYPLFDVYILWKNQFIITINQHDMKFADIYESDKLDKKQLKTIVQGLYNRTF